MILPFSFLLLSIGIYAGIIENFERSIIAKLIFVLFVLYDLAKHASASRRQRFLTVPAEEVVTICERLSCQRGWQRMRLAATADDSHDCSQTCGFEWCA